MYKLTLEQAIDLHGTGIPIYIIPGDTFSDPTHSETKEKVQEMIGIDTFDMWYDGPLRILSFEKSVYAVVINERYYDKTESPNSLLKQLISDSGSNERTINIAIDNRVPNWGLKEVEGFLENDFWRLTNKEGLYEYAKSQNKAILDLD